MKESYFDALRRRKNPKNGSNNDENRTMVSTSDSEKDVRFSNRTDTNVVDQEKKEVEKADSMSSITEEPIAPANAQENRMQSSGRKSPHYFSFVIDATADVARVYPGLYKMLKAVLEKLDSIHRTEGIDIRIGITTFHDEVSGDEDKFGDSFFTENFKEVDERLKNMKFWGGNTVTGHECINEAQLEGLTRMSNQREKYANCAQVLITTSIPHESTPIFCPKEEDFRMDFGVRFALNIVYDSDKYTPYFQIVDDRGEPTTGYRLVLNISDILKGKVNCPEMDRVSGDKETVISEVLNYLLFSTSLHVSS